MTSFYPWFKYYLRKEETWVKVFRLIKRCSAVIRFLTGISVNIAGKHNFPSTPYIVIANHASYIDTFLMYSVVPDYFVFLGKSELKSWPIFRIFFTSGMNVSVERGSIRGSHRAFNTAKQKMEKGRCICIFPEGGIFPDAPKLHRFKNGAFRLAIQKQVPIIPVTILNSSEIFESNNLLAGYGGPDTAKIIVHPPVKTKGMSEEDLVPLRQHCYGVINQSLKEYESNR